MWLKKHNHLYQELEFNSGILKAFLEELATEEAEENEENVDNDGDFNREETVEEITDIFEEHQIFEEPLISENEVISAGQTTCFMDRYADTISDHTVVQKLADMIVEFEISNGILIEDAEDFDLDNEMVNDEEFFKTVEENKSDLKSGDDMVYALPLVRMASLKIGV